MNLRTKVKNILDKQFYEEWNLHKSEYNDVVADKILTLFATYIHEMNPRLHRVSERIKLKPNERDVFDKGVRFAKDFMLQGIEKGEK